MKKLTNEQLKKLCVENNWFTKASEEQYEKLFYINFYDVLDDKALARFIWLYSDENVTKQEILDKLEETIVYHDKTELTEDGFIAFEGTVTRRIGTLVQYYTGAKENEKYFVVEHDSSESPVYCSKLIHESLVPEIVKNMLNGCEKK